MAHDDLIAGYQQQGSDGDHWIDSLSKTLAHRTSRRTILKIFAIGTIAGMFALDRVIQTASASACSNDTSCYKEVDEKAAQVFLNCNNMKGRDDDEGNPAVFKLGCLAGSELWKSNGYKACDRTMCSPGLYVGTTLAFPMTCCGGFCSDTASETNNCGACGIDCTTRDVPGSTQVSCIQSRCEATSCAAGFLLSGGTCVCPDGALPCGGSCCRKEKVSHSTAVTCSGGACVATGCEGTYTVSGGTCTCPNGCCLGSDCVSGICCSGTCSYLNDNNNCGSCGNACAAGKVCVPGGDPVGGTVYQCVDGCMGSPCLPPAQCCPGQSCVLSCPDPWGDPYPQYWCGTKVVDGGCSTSNSTACQGYKCTVEVGPDGKPRAVAVPA